MMTILLNPFHLFATQTNTAIKKQHLTSMYVYIYIYVLSIYQSIYLSPSPRRLRVAYSRRQLKDIKRQKTHLIRYETIDSANAGLTPSQCHCSI